MYDYEGTSLALPQFTETGVYVGSKHGDIVALGGRKRSLLRNAWKTATNPYGVAAGLVGTAILAGVYRHVHSGGTSDTADSSRNPSEFDVQEHVGSGPTGTVDAVRGLEGETVALERFPEIDCSDEEFVEAVAVWSDLDHDGVLPVRDWGTDPQPWMTTAYVKGGSLADRLDDLDRAAAVEVVSSVAETVHRAHREGVVHGRLHPGNVLFGDTDREDVLVGDWLGAATRADLPRGYAAPEGRGNGATDEGGDHVAVDVYQLGALAAEVLTGDPPTNGEFDAGGLPAELADVLETALASDPDERHDSALAFRDVLRWSAFQA